MNLKWDDSRIYRRKSGEYDLAYQTYNLMLGLGVVFIIILLILLIVSIVAAILIGKMQSIRILLVITGIIGLF